MKPPFWAYLLIASGACFYMCIKTLNDPNGDALLWFFAAPTLFLFAVLAKAMKEDNQMRAQNPEYVRTIDLLIPIAIVQFWKPALFVILAVGIWLFGK